MNEPVQNGIAKRHVPDTARPDIYRKHACNYHAFASFARSLIYDFQQVSTLIRGFFLLARNVVLEALSAYSSKRSLTR